MYCFFCAAPLLKSVNLKRVRDLTPKARKLYDTVKVYMQRSKVNRRRRIAFMKKKSAAAKAIKVVNSGLRSEAVQFCLRQLQRKAQNSKGRRYTIEEKLLSLALYKESGTGYRFLSKFFCLPSKRSLMRLLNLIPITPGINSFLMENLKTATTNFKRREKHCILMFDAISLKPHLDYVKSDDEIVGIGNGRYFQLIEFLWC